MTDNVIIIFLYIYRAPEIFWNRLAMKLAVQITSLKARELCRVTPGAFILMICYRVIFWYFLPKLCQNRRFRATVCRWNWALAMPRFKQQHEQVILGWLMKCCRRWGLWMCVQFLVLLPGAKFAGPFWLILPGEMDGNGMLSRRSPWCMYLPAGGKPRQ